MLILGKRDNLVGDPAIVRTLAQHATHIDIEVVDSGHLIGVEQADYVNTQIAEFFGQPILAEVT